MLIKIVNPIESKIGTHKIKSKRVVNSYRLLFNSIQNPKLRSIASEARQPQIQNCEALRGAKRRGNLNPKLNTY
jgi:hypothetical protein